MFGRNRQKFPGKKCTAAMARMLKGAQNHPGIKKDNLDLFGFLRKSCQKLSKSEAFLNTRAVLGYETIN